MNKWLKKHITVNVIMTLIVGFSAAVATAAVFKSDVDRLKAQMDGLPENISAIKATLISQGEDIKFIKNYIIRP